MELNPDPIDNNMYLWGIQFWVSKHIKYLGRWILNPWGSFEATCNSNKSFSSKTGCNFFKNKKTLFYFDSSNRMFSAQEFQNGFLGMEYFGFAFWVSLEAELSKVTNKQSEHPWSSALETWIYSLPHS